jgi:hypothetical protein
MSSEPFECSPSRVLASAFRRALTERKFRVVLRRPGSIPHLPEILRLRLFLKDEKDHLDSQKCRSWMAMFKKLELFHQELRRNQLELSVVVAPEHELAEYEKRLAYDIEQGPGGDLVRTLGGSRAARNKLDEVRSQLGQLKESLKTLREHGDKLEVK